MIVELNKDNKEVISAFTNNKIKLYFSGTHILIDTLVKPKIKIEGVEYQTPTFIQEVSDVFKSKRYRNNKVRRSIVTRSNRYNNK